MENKSFVGSKKLDNLLEAICKDGEAKRKRGIPIPPLGIYVKDRTYIPQLVNHITDTYENSGRVQNRNIDRYFEVSFKDGNIFEVNEALYDISSTSVYENIENFSDTVIFIDLSSFDYENKDEFEFFVKQLSRMKKCPFVLFDNENSEWFSIFAKSFPSLRVVEINSYSYKQLVEHADCYAREYNVHFNSNAKETLLEIFSNSNVTEYKDVTNLVLELLYYIPDKDIISATDLKQFINALSKGGK